VIVLALGIVLLGRMMIYVFTEATWMSELISPVASLHAISVSISPVIPR
jgi:hypothetical protein